MQFHGCGNFIGSFSGALMLLFLLAPAHSDALKCYIGQQNASLPVYGEPQMCQPGSVTCTKTYDPSMNMAHRQCSMTNCTLNGMPSTVSTCTNSTQYPYTTYCCCYGEACNSVPHVGALSGWILMIVGIILTGAPFLLKSN